MELLSLKKYVNAKYQAYGLESIEKWMTTLFFIRKKEDMFSMLFCLFVGLSARLSKFKDKCHKRWWRMYKDRSH